MKKILITALLCLSVNHAFAAEVKPIELHVTVTKNGRVQLDSTMRASENELTPLESTTEHTYPVKTHKQENGKVDLEPNTVRLGVVGYLQSKLLDDGNVLTKYSLNITDIVPARVTATSGTSISFPETETVNVVNAFNTKNGDTGTTKVGEYVIKVTAKKVNQ